MHDVNGFTSSQQLFCGIGLHDFSKFFRGAWQGDVLVSDTAHLRQENMKTLLLPVLVDLGVAAQGPERGIVSNHIQNRHDK